MTDRESFFRGRGFVHQAVKRVAQSFARDKMIDAFTLLGLLPNEAITAADAALAAARALSQESGGEHRGSRVKVPTGEQMANRRAAVREMVAELEQKLFDSEPLYATEPFECPKDHQLYKGVLVQGPEPTPNSPEDLNRTLGELAEIEELTEALRRKIVGRLERLGAEEEQQTASEPRRQDPIEELRALGLRLHREARIDDMNESFDGQGLTTTFRTATGGRAELFIALTRPAKEVPRG